VRALLAAAVLMATPAQAAWRHVDLPKDDLTLRAVAVAAPGIFHVSGSRGTSMRSVDGGKTWQAVAPPAEALFDYRGVAVAGGALLIMISGPAEQGEAQVLRGRGRHWTTPFRLDEPGGFLDAIAFRSAREGLVLGDPIGGRWFLIRTGNGGRSWTRLQGPEVKPGEAAFAASNSALFLGPGREAWIVSGGLARGRVFHSRDDAATWTVSETPISAGATSGLFGGLALGPGRAVVVGGDYKDELRPGPSIAVTADGGATWTLPPHAGTPRLLEGVARRDAKTLLAVGPRGTSVSRDNGSSWRQVDEEAFHAIACGKGACVAAGARGKVAVWHDD
jgi:photosystem II stability/assembly factor-like uncharacterized protein